MAEWLSSTWLEDREDRQITMLDHFDDIGPYFRTAWTRVADAVIELVKARVAEERKACADIADDHATSAAFQSSSVSNEATCGIQEVASAIRARGGAK